MQQNYVLQHHRSYKIVVEKKPWVIPTGVRWKISKAFHDGKGQFDDQRNEIPSSAGRFRTILTTSGDSERFRAIPNDS